MKTIFRTAALGLLAGILGCTAANPPTAQQVLDGARAQAADQHKSIFLLFGASW